METRTPLWKVLIASLGAVGLVSRAAPLLDQGGRLLRQFPTEDGYLMLTIARNLALGHGMSTAAGTLPTNGTQPLATFLYALCFWVVGGEKKVGVVLALVLQLAVATATAWLLYRLGRRALSGRPHAAETAALAGAVWYAAPHSVSHTMNGLETGVYVLCVVAVAHAILALGPAERPALGRFAGLGALLGVAFWARNDAVWLCAALGVAHLAGWLPLARAPFRQRLAELAVAGAVTAAVALPWVVSNLIRFGHVVPVSGQAESMAAELGQNLGGVGPKLFEHATLLLPIPGALESRPLVVIATLLLLAALAVAAPLAARGWSDRERGLAAVALLYGLGLVSFYGLAFGAGHFMSRYLFPLAPFFGLLWAAGTRAAWERLRRTRGPAPRYALAAVVAVLAIGLNVRLYLKGDHHSHFQVVRWVETHVSEEAWVGAVQTGTLGFFHDRTLNLDGKVNPEALEARAAGRIPAYVVESRIDYIADWVGIERWLRKEPLGDHFELVVRDPERNLTVLRRKDPRVAVTSADG